LIKIKYLEIKKERYMLENDLLEWIWSTFEIVCITSRRCGSE